MRINLDGLFYCCHAVLPAMRAQKDGLIINVSSWAGRYASCSPAPAYNATKRAVIAITETINMEECMQRHPRLRHPARARSRRRSWRSARCRPRAEERARMLQPDDFGKTIRFVATLPAHACINELVISPTWNRIYAENL